MVLIGVNFPHPHAFTPAPVVLYGGLSITLEYPFADSLGLPHGTIQLGGYVELAPYGIDLGFLVAGGRGLETSFFGVGGGTFGGLKIGSVQEALSGRGQSIGAGYGISAAATFSANGRLNGLELGRVTGFYAGHTFSETLTFSIRP